MSEIASACLAACLIPCYRVSGYYYDYYRYVAKTNAV